MTFELTSDGQIRLVVETSNWSHSKIITTEEAQDMWAQLGRCLNKQNDDPNHLG